MYSKHLRQIANALLINSQTTNTYALFSGALGISLFLYNYSRYTNKKNYSDYSDNLIEVIYDKLSTHSPKHFDNGLAGIGWAIDYIVKNKFVEADDDSNILEDLDDAIGLMNKDDFIKEMKHDTPLFSKGLYFLQRGMEEKMKEVLFDCDILLDINQNQIPISYLNSILYVVNAANNLDIMSELCNSILVKLYPIVSSKIDENMVQNHSDIYVLRRNIRNINSQNKEYKWLKLMEKFEQPKLDLLEIGWIHFIYKYDSEKKKAINLLELQNILNVTTQDLDSANLPLYNGLAGLGLELIRLSK